ncbi:MAG: ribosome-associated translation inhibitor RaiA [Deltaproteobacteria bacterium]|nr:ribosome-associated translation inhibitor RaiA [Deltaproteobacteria bacterium]MDL1960295.1 ribosome-associated translation inhibitor RaiA [Deltaproteobacteria bacterium]
MQINVTFRRLDPSDALREYAENRLQKLKKYADGPMDVNVVLSVEKFRQTADVVISGDGVRAAAREEQNEMRAAIDLVSDKIYKQLKRYKEKIRSKRGSGSMSEEVLSDISPSPEIGREGLGIISTKKMDAKPMAVEEAAAQFQSLNQNFMMFANAETNAINVLYWRMDGTLGLVEP